MTSSITDWIQVCFTTIAGCYAIFLFGRNLREKQKKFLLNIFNYLYNDEDVTDILYYVDSGNNQDLIKYKGSLERKADKTLHYLDFVGKFIKEGDLKYDDLIKFKYEIRRILNNQEVKNYIEWLREKLGVPLEYLPYLEKLINQKK